MKRSLSTIAASLLAMALTTGPVLAGSSYVLTLDSKQDSALAWAVAQQPVPEAPASPVTAESLLQEVVDNAVKQWAARQETTVGEEFKGKWGKLTKAEREKVCAVVPMEECE